MKSTNELAKTVWMQADRTCQRAEECVNTSRIAIGYDCSGYYINKDSMPKLAKDRADLIDPLVKKWNDGDCASQVPIPIPTCPASWPDCDEKGLCTSGPPPHPIRLRR